MESILSNMVAPVVVKPDMVSKKASVTLSIYPPNKKGNMPKNEKRIQIRVTINMPSRRPADFSLALKPNAQNKKPVAAINPLAIRKGKRSLSPYRKATPVATNMNRVSKRHILPNIFNIKRIFSMFN